MKTKIYLLFITTLFFCAGCGNKSGGQKQESVSAAKDTYVNPLFPEGADPSALFHNGKYYYTHGTEDKIMLWETSDITDMAHAVCKIVWKPQDPSNSCHLWAPEIHYINDIYIMQPTTVIRIITSCTYLKTLHPIRWRESSK